MKNAMQLKAIMKKLAKENQISAQLVLQNYMLERFLERVSLSPYRDNYIIKGGFLISSMVGLNSRATMDMDATIKGYPVTQDAVQKMIEQILTVSVDDDITFTFKSIGEIREGDEYTGYRVALTADFPPMAVPLKLDITTGDKITPREIQYDYKLMLEDRHIQVMAYNLATILAEKLETVISRSDQNTRPRDYYDVYILTKLQAENIDFPALGAALMATASKRGSDSILQDYRAIVEDIRVSNIVMSNIKKEAIVLNLKYSKMPAEPKSDRTPEFRNIYVSGVTVRDVNTPIMVVGLPEAPITGIVMRDVYIQNAKQRCVFEDCKDLVLDDVYVDGKEIK